MKKIAVLLVFLGVFASCGEKKDPAFLAPPEWLVGSWDQNTTPTTVSMTFTADDIYYSDRYGDYLYSEKYGAGYAITEETGEASGLKYYKANFLEGDAVTGTLYQHQFILLTNNTTVSYTYKKVDMLSSSVLIKSSTNLYRQ